MIQKILIAAPTADVKNYCFEKWLLNINEFTYPNFEVVVFDNTVDNGENAQHLNEVAAKLCLKFDFKAIASEFRKGSEKSLIQRMCDSHNDCLDYAYDNNYKNWLHLETDVMPEPNVIEQLLSHGKKVVGGLYYRDEGRSRKLMIQRKIYRAPNNIVVENFTPEDDLWFVDGTLKKVAHVGLGCTMINEFVFSRLKFRFKKGIDASPDTYFSEDCFKNNIDIFADTSLICGHDNQPWGNFGVDYKA